MRDRFSTQVQSCNFAFVLSPTVIRAIFITEWYSCLVRVKPVVVYPFHSSYLLLSSSSDYYSRLVI